MKFGCARCLKFSPRIYTFRGGDKNHEITKGDLFSNCLYYGDNSSYLLTERLVLSVDTENDTFWRVLKSSEWGFNEMHTEMQSLALRRQRACAERVGSIVASRWLETPPFVQPPPPRFCRKGALGASVQITLPNGTTGGGGGGGAFPECTRSFYNSYGNFFCFHSWRKSYRITRITTCTKACV